MKTFGFIELNDGSCFRNLQVVMDANSLSNYKEIAAQNVGAALIVRGTVVLTPEAKQPLEVKATEIEVEGVSSPDYPLQKKRHSVEFLRTIQHLRPRTNLFSATFRVRSVAAQAVHEFFRNNGFVYVHTPIITGSDCEGAGEMFKVTTFDLANVPKNEDGSERKMSMVDRFHASFNAAYGKVQDRYRNGVRRIVERPIIAIASVIVGIVAMGVLMATTKTGLVPDEDTGTVFCTVSTPPGTSMKKTQEVMDQVDRMLATNPAIESRMRITGYNFIAGQGSNQGTFIVKLKSFEERQKMEGPLKYVGVHNLGSTMVLGMIYKQTAAIKGAQILAFQPPMVQGFSATNGLTFSMQDRTGGDVNKFFDVTQSFIAELNKRPEISNAMTSYNTKYPQYKIDVDVAKCKQSGIDPSTVLTTMQGYYGGMYASNFNAYGKLYRVYIQSDPKDRADLKSLDNIYVRTSAGEMAPIKEYVSLTRVYGPQEIDRFNLFTSINVNASAAEGYSTGDALKAMAEVAKTSLPAGYSYEFSGLTRNEQESSNSTAMIFILCLTFVYLILAAQYESYLLPLSVILSIPFGLAGAFLFTNMFGNNNDIYMQIALIMLMGLLAKNAILIVQFALERRQTGMAISWSAVLGAAARLRPILMTSLAMIIGLLPMLMPWGVGYHGNMTLGAAAIGGMLIGMLCQIMIVPALFYIFQTLQEKVKPIEFEDDNADVATELKQYTNPLAANFRTGEEKLAGDKANPNM